MARRRTKIGVGPEVLADLKQRLGATTDLREKERLQVALWATRGQHTLAELAQLAGRARSTIQIWLDCLVAGGVEGLLQREAPPGLTSPLAQPKVQEQLQEGLKAGRWRTAAQVASWLEQAHGIKRVAKSLYRWLGKAGGALRVPRPCHVQQDPLAAAAFRAELEQRLEKLALPKDKPVKIWVADESRFGLHTQSRRCWALRGQRVVIPQQQRYEWEYVYGALEVVQGGAEFRFMPSVSLDFSRGFLEQIAASDLRAEHLVIWDTLTLSSPARRRRGEWRLHRQWFQNSAWPSCWTRISAWRKRTTCIAAWTRCWSIVRRCSSICASAGRISSARSSRCCSTI